MLDINLIRKDHEFVSEKLDLRGLEIDFTEFLANDQKRIFFDSLPNEFTRKEAVEKSASYRLSARTVDDILRAATGKTLTKIKSGLYQKI